MKHNLKNRPKLFDYYQSSDENYDTVRKEINTWFDGFEKELRELRARTGSQVVRIDAILGESEEAKP